MEGNSGENISRELSHLLVRSTSTSFKTFKASISCPILMVRWGLSPVHNTTLVPALHCVERQIANMISHTSVDTMLKLKKNRSTPALCKHDFTHTSVTAILKLRKRQLQHYAQSCRYEIMSTNWHSTQCNTMLTQVSYCEPGFKVAYTSRDGCSPVSVASYVCQVRGNINQSGEIVQQV